MYQNETVRILKNTLFMITAENSEPEVCILFSDRPSQMSEYDKKKGNAWKENVL
jgi:hypothetical protein